MLINGIAKCCSRSILWTLISSQIYLCYWTLNCPLLKPDFLSHASDSSLSPVGSMWAERLSLSNSRLSWGSARPASPEKVGTKVQWSQSTAFRPHKTNGEEVKRQVAPWRYEKFLEFWNDQWHHWCHYFSPTNLCYAVTDLPKEMLCLTRQIA